MKYTSPIDPHVHLRWSEYADQKFTYHSLEDAHAVGLAAVMEMGNTDPPIIDAERIERRLQVLDGARGTLARFYQRHVAHYIHPGLTDRMMQVAGIFILLKQGHPRVRAAKMYTCHSTGNMGLLTPRTQQNVWHMAAEIGWDGTIIVHAEDHTRFGNPSLAEANALHRSAPGWPASREFDPVYPITHSLYQHEEAEVLAAVQQLRYAREAQFKGVIVFAHVSSPDTVDAVFEELADDDPFTIAFEVTWHHLFLNAEDDYPAQGNRVKMNPPLRRKASQERLLNLLFAGKIDMIGSDHAPHPVERKDSDDPPSGIPALPFWPRGIELLRKDGMSEPLLRDVTFGHAASIYLPGIKPYEVEVEYDPGLWEKWGYNPFARWG